MMPPSQERAIAASTLGTENLTSIVAWFDEQVALMAVEERNDREKVRKAISKAIDHYAMGLQARTGKALSSAERVELAEIIEREAPAIIAKRNADQLANDLIAIEAALSSSGLGVREMRRLSSEVEFLRRDLLRDGHYHREHDDALVRMASVVRTASGAWAENHLNMLERYLGKGRWWLR